MPAHIKQKNEYGYWYLIDGNVKQSLRTTVKREAEVKLKLYIQGRLSLTPCPTVGKFYQDWILKQVAPLVRKNLARDYRQIFTRYVLPKFRNRVLSDIETKDLIEFRAELIGSGLSVKTARNIIDGSFRAMFKAARIEIRGDLEGYDPFIDIEWPRQKKIPPDPFTAEERDNIVRWYIENDFFYYPLIAWQFLTAMRPSETFALTWQDIDLEHGVVSINKSRSAGEIAATKTKNSERIIQIDQALIDLLKLLPSRQVGIEHVFVGKRGDPMSKKWAEHSWAGPLKTLQIRHRKFYATRHTYITERVRQGDKLKEIADYVGTSVTMIENNYCGKFQTKPDNRQVIDKWLTDQSGRDKENSNLGGENVVAGPGFEPGTSRL